MKTYRVTLLGLPIDTSACPPAIASALWPSFDGWPCEVSAERILVTVPDSATAPADLGPLVKVETVTA